MPFRKESGYDMVEPKYSMSYSIGPSGYGVQRPRYPLTSPVEIRDILAAVAALTVAFYFIISLSYPENSWPTNLGIAALTVVAGFFIHEMAHKVLARRYGCWAEFRASYPMLGLAVMMSFFGVLFAAPGAVMIAGNITREQNGKISIVGPMSNLAVAALMLPLAVFSIQGVPEIVNIAAYGLCLFSVVLAGFNLLPFMPFDGAKVWAWNKPVYVAALLATGALFLLIYPIF